MKPLRIGLLADLAPRKLGSMEAWLLAMAAEARRRGHEMQFFVRPPVHPEVALGLDRVGASWAAVEELVRHPLRSIAHFARQFDVLHVNLFAPRHPVSLITYAAWPARVLFVDHFSGSVNGTPMGSGGARALLDRATLLRVHALAGVSSHVRDRTVARFRFPASRARTIYNGVDLQRFRPDWEATDALPELRIITVAYLIPEKGIEYLLRACEQVKSLRARLLIVGDGPDEPRLRTLAGSLGLLSRVEFLGLRDDVPDLLRTAHIFVHPCVWQEACPLGVIEAMASGCALIASRAGGIPELVSDGRTGLLVPPGEPEPLAAALKQLLSDGGLRRRLARAGRQEAVERFGLEACVAAHLDWCEENAGRGSPGLRAPRS